MRTRAPDLPVAPAARARRSRRVTRFTPRRVRLKAVLAPLTPPPITTTSALVTAGIVTRLTRFTEGPITSPHTAVYLLMRPRTDPMEEQSMALTRRELLKSVAALGAAGTLSPALPRRAQAQTTTPKKDLVVAQGGDISRFDPH